jgi:LCP family protein required for cell wall assembly
MHPNADFPRSPGRPAGRTVGQRVVLVANIGIAVVCLIAAGALVIAQRNLDKIQRVDAAPALSQTKPIPKLVLESLLNGADQNAAPVGDAAVATVSTLPAGSVKGVNFLLTGADSRGCIDPNSPYAGAFLGAGDGGSRPDTIMLLHIEPDTGHVAILSFPRDLWVPVAGTNHMSKINSAFDKNDPKRLIATIQSFFQIQVDHYISIDFCVFKDLVNAVGGISIPFSTPLKDNNTGLNVRAAGCYKFDGDSALAYARSRHLKYQTKSGKWIGDGTADIGRIKRQQDFIRRLMQKVRSKGALDLGLVTRLINSFQKRVVVDANLTASDMLQLANALKGFDPATTRSFIVQGRLTMKGTVSVVEPVLGSARMQSILAAYRNRLRLADTPTAEKAVEYGNKSILPDPNGHC